MASPATLALGANTVTWSVTDGSGLQAISTQTVTVVDDQKPTIATLSPISVNADAGVCTFASAQLTAPSAADNCSVASVVASPATLALGANTVTWSVTDGSGLQAISTQTVTVVDDQKPTIATLSPISVNADAGVCTFASAQLTAPSAADNCSVASVVASPATLALGANTVTWSVTDGSGLQATSTQTVTVVDDQKPTIATLSPISVNADAGVCTFASAQLTAPSAADNCSVASVVASPATLALGANTVTWSVTDGSGLQAISTQTVTVVDDQKPTIATLSPISVNADAGVCTFASAQLTAPSAADNCSVASVVASPVTLALGANTVTWSVTDGSGLQATSTQTVTVVDDQKPTIATLSPISVNADAGVCTFASAQLTAPSAADNCSVASVVASPATLALGANTVTWSVTDGSGLQAISTQTVTVVDDQKPTIATLSPISVNADAGVCTFASAQLTAPSAADNCSVASVVASPATLALGANTVTWSVTDGSGLQATVSTQTVTVVDDQKPTIATLSPISVNADAGVCTFASAQLTAPSAADNCSVASVVASPATLALGANTVTWSVTDGSGLQATSTQTVTVVDDQKPTIATLSPISVNADAGVCTFASAQLTAPSAADNCSVASVVASPATLALGANTVTWSVTDGSGLQAISTQTVTVVDDQKPTIATLSPISVNADAGVCTFASAQLTAPSAADNCSVASVVASPATLALGANTVTWSVTDGSGLQAISTQTVTVVDDQKPTIATLSPISVNADAGVCTFASAQLTAPSAADNCSVASVVASPATLALGANTVTWSVTDGSGLQATSTQTVTVVDDQKPTIATLSPISVNADAGVCTFASAQLTAPSAADNCSVASVVASPATLALGANTVTWSVTDGSGLQATSTQTVTVVDDQKPEITCPANITIDVPESQCNAIVAITPATATDNCGQSNIFSIIGTRSDKQPLNAAYPIGTTTITWTATDQYVNYSTCQQTVTVNGNTIPEITCPANIVINAEPGLCTVGIPEANLGSATLSTTCGISGLFKFRSDFKSWTDPYKLGVTTIYWTAMDAFGQPIAFCDQTVTVEDHQQPLISGCPSNITVNSEDLNPQSCSQAVSWTEPTATDNCNGAVTVIKSHEPGAIFEVGTTTVTYTFRDAANNSSTCSFNVTVVDNTAPVIVNCPETISVNTDESTGCSKLVSFTAPSATDNCGTVTTVITVNGIEVSALPETFPVGSTRVVYAFTDTHGNSNSCSFNIVVTDNTMPTITCPADVSVCEGESVTIGNPAINDNCGVASTTGERSDGLALDEAYPVGVTTIIWKVTDIHDNTNTCTQKVTVNPLPVAGIENNTGTTILTCTHPQISVTATGGASHSWSDGTTVVGNDAILSINKPGTYTVTAITTNGCTDTESIMITQDIAVPTVAIVQPPTTVLTCTTPSISLTASGGESFAWSNGQTTASIDVTAPDTYSVTATSANGCSDTENITVTQDNTVPVAAITNNSGTTVLTCAVQAISVTATGGSTYSWSGGLGNNANASITEPGTYTVTATSANGCSDTESITVTRDNTVPEISISSSNGLALNCTVPSTILTATEGVSYAWSTGETTRSITVGIAGTYSVTVTPANGCQATASVETTMDNTGPVAAITNNSGTTVLTCAVQAISVTATGGSTYSWSGGLGNNANASITEPGTYTITVTSANGCSDMKSITVTQDNTVPVAGITNNTGVTILTCTTPSISLTASGGQTYAWSSSQTTASIDVTTPATYTVTVTAANGCTSTESITITQDATTPVAAITNNTGETVLTCSTQTISVTITHGMVELLLQQQITASMFRVSIPSL